MEFELIKKYPGLPNWVKEGDKALKSTDPDVNEYAVTKFDRRPYLAATLRGEDVENHPNFWKPLPKKEEKPYEILAFNPGYKSAALYKKTILGVFKNRHNRERSLESLLKNSRTYPIHTIRRSSDGQEFSVGDETTNGTIKRIDPTGTIHMKEGHIYGCKTDVWEELELAPEREYKILKMRPRAEVPPYKITQLSQASCHSRVKNGHLIHTIERLSDGEVFSVGDYITYINGKSPRTIENFCITGDKLKATVLLESGLRQYYRTGHLQKAEPYLVTEDGEKIYKGTTPLFFPKKDTTVEDNYVTWSIPARAAKEPVFYKKEACEKWIERNKPKYSVSEVEIIKQSIWL